MQQFSFKSIIGYKVWMSLRSSTLGLILFKPIALFRWWKIWGGIPVLCWIRAAEYFRAGDFRSALSLYEKGLNRYPYNRARRCAALDYAYCLYRLERFDESLVVLNKLTRGARPLKDAFLLQAKIQLAYGLRFPVLITLSRAVKIFPKDVQVLTRYAHSIISISGSAHRIESAKNKILAFKRDISIEDPRMVKLDTALANIELYLGNREKGERLLSRALATGEAPFEAYLLRGEYFLESGRLVIAREQLKRAMRLSPLDPRPIELLAKSYFDADEAEVLWAKQLATRACELSAWQNPDYVKTLVDAYNAVGDTDAAEVFSARHKELTSTSRINISSIKMLEVQIERLRSI